MFIIWKSLSFEISWHSKSGTWPWILKLQKIIYTVLKLNFYNKRLSDLQTHWDLFSYSVIGDLKLVTKSWWQNRLIYKQIEDMVLRISYGWPNPSPTMLVQHIKIETSVTNLEQLLYLEVLPVALYHQTR